MERDSLRLYEPPEWLNGRLRYQPTHRVQLANLPTPIHGWDLPGQPRGITLAIKRDDNTETALSGNKARKMEFFIADAIGKGCKHVATAGAFQSNHCRATALAAVRYGLQPHLFLRSDSQNPVADDAGYQGNLLLNRLCGAKMYIAPRSANYETDLEPRMEKAAAKIKETTGEDTYLIPIGGSDKVGAFGYLHAFEELIQQGVLEQYDDLIVACGSGGTAEGLAIGNYLTGSKLKVHAILVSASRQHFEDHVNEVLKDLGIHSVKCDDILDLIDGYKGKGYNISTQEELDFILKVSLSTGVILDPVYTGKAAYGLVQELNRNPQRFQGNRVLFVHTGGIFEMFDGRIEDTLTRKVL